MLITSNAATATRRESLNGRDYLVRNVVMIVSGVLSGSQGPLFYPADEIRRSVDTWNGMPITLEHPRVSARQPGVIAKAGLGTIYNATIVGQSLVAEAWFDIEKVRSLSPELLSRLTSNHRIEVSTGLGVDQQPQPGTFNGREFRAVARNFRPDHLAVLPHGEGACSVNDGCGIRNQNQPDDVLQNFVRNHSQENAMYDDDDNFIDFNSLDDDDFDDQPVRRAANREVVVNNTADDPVLNIMFPPPIDYAEIVNERDQRWGTKNNCNCGCHNHGRQQTRNEINDDGDESLRMMMPAETDYAAIVAENDRRHGH
jgi:hypothetical protein